MQQIIFEYDEYYSLKISLTVQSDSKTVGEGVKQKSDVIIKKTLQCYEAKSNRQTVQLTIAKTDVSGFTSCS